MRMPTYACGCTNVLACPRLFDCVLTPQSPWWLPGQQAVIDNNWKIVHAPGTGQCTMQVGANVCEWIGGGAHGHMSLLTSTHRKAACCQSRLSLRVHPIKRYACHDAYRPRNSPPTTPGRTCRAPPSSSTWTPTTTSCTTSPSPTPSSTNA